MSVGAFTDKKHQPTDAEITEAIGPRFPLYEELAGALRARYAAEEDFHFLYGKNYGWARRFRVKAKMLANLYPAQGCFKAQVNLSPQAVDEALAMDLGENARRAIAAAHPYPEGRWLFIAVESEGDVRDALRLLELRARDERIR